MELLGGSLAGERIAVCALSTGQVFCVDADACSSQKFEILQQATISVLYNETKIFVAAQPAAVLRDVHLRFDQTPKAPCLKNPLTPVYFGKALPFEAYGALCKVSFLSLSRRVIVTTHPSFIIFHSLDDFTQPHAIIQTDATILDHEFGWDRPLPRMSQSYSPQFMRSIVEEFFSVAVLTKDASGSQIRRVPFFLPPVGELSLPNGVVDVLMLLWDTWMNDPKGELRTLFSHEEKLVRKGDTLIDVRAMYRGYLTPSLVPCATKPLANLRQSAFGIREPRQSWTTLQEVWSNHQLRFDDAVITGGGPATPTLVPNAPAAAPQGSSSLVPNSEKKSGRDFETMADEARAKVLQVNIGGKLSEAFRRRQDKDALPSIEEQTLQFCQCLQRVATDVIRPLEEYSATLICDTGNSFGEQLPAHTCLLRNKIKNLLEEIASSVANSRRRDAIIENRIKELKKRQETLNAKSVEVMKAYSRLIRRESHAAVLRVMGDYVAEYESSPLTLPNVRGILDTLRAPKLFESANRVMSDDACLTMLCSDPGSYTLNSWKTILETCESIDKIRQIR